MNVAVVGGGPAGLLTALLLVRRGVARDVVVWERDLDGATGLGVILPDRLHALLREVAPDVGDAIAGRCARWRTVSVRRGDESWHRRLGPELAALARPALNRILREACASGGVVLEARAAPPVRALRADHDLVVGADGAGSSITRDGFTVRITRIGPLYAWLGIERPVAGLTFLARPTPRGLYLAHAYPYSPTASTFLVEGPAPLTLSQVRALFGEEPGEGGTQDSRPWRRFRERVVRPWSLGNVVLVGDAAHTAHYSIGHGTYLAFGDAVALVDSLAAEPCLDAALLRYERTRRPVAEAIQQQGRASAEWFARAGTQLDLPMGRFVANLVTREGRLERPGGDHPPKERSRHP